MEIKRIFIFLIVLLLIVDLAYFYPRITGKGVYEWESVNVTRVLDGDTLEVNAGLISEKIRLICINAPEKKRPLYEEAKVVLSELEGKEIQILRDKEDEDKYDRKLRYVSYKGKLVNKEILEEGLATVYMCEGLKYEKELKEAEERAMEQEKGAWKKSTGKCANCILLKELNAEEEYFIIENICNFSCSFEAKDEANHFFDISLNSFEEKTIKSETNVWNNDEDSLFLRDDKGLLLYYHYEPF